MKYCYKICILIITIILIVLFNSFTKSSSKSGFQNYCNRNTWSDDLIKRFNIYQTTMNENVNQFDMEQLQKQVSPEEAEEYLKTGLWNWSDSLKNLYVSAVRRNPIIRIDPQFALNYAMKIYNQNAVRELLAWNTKEGHFLLYGADLGVSDGMPKNMNNTLKCSTDDKNNSVLEKTEYSGFNLWNGQAKMTKINIEPENIPNEMRGFSFVKSPCNPCVALNSPGDFSCPFKINVKGDDSISETWKQLWNVE